MITRASLRSPRTVRPKPRPATASDDLPERVRHRCCRRTGAAGLVAVFTLVFATVLGTRTDVLSRPALHSFLENSGSRLFIAWLFMVVSGLAWLGFVVGLRSILPAGPSADLFGVGAVLAQALTWCGASLNTAAAAPDARGLSLPVFNALGEAAHLTTAAGVAATGLALLGLAASGATVLWSTTFAKATGTAGVLLILTAVIGPLSLPVLVLWTTTAAILVLRAGTAAPVSVAAEG